MLTSEGLDRVSGTARHSDVLVPGSVLGLTLPASSGKGNRELRGFVLDVLDRAGGVARDRDALVPGSAWQGDRGM